MVGKMKGEEGGGRRRCSSGGWEGCVVVFYS